LVVNRVLPRYGYLAGWLGWLACRLTGCMVGERRLPCTAAATVAAAVHAYCGKEPTQTVGSLFELACLE
jgi:hypothetical protein